MGNFCTGSACGIQRATEYLNTSAGPIKKKELFNLRAINRNIEKMNGRHILRNHTSQLYHN